MNKSYKGMIYIFISAMLLSTSGLFVKKISADPIAITALRSVIAGLTLLPFVKFRKVKFKPLFLAYIASYAVMVTTFIMATKFTTSANTIALQYTGALYLYIYSVLRKKIKVQLNNLMPMIFIVIGICCFLMEPNKGSSAVGNILAIISGVALAGMFALSSKLEDIQPVAMVCFSNLFTAVITAPFIPSYAALMSISISGWISLLYLGSVQVALAYVFNIKGIQLTTSMQAMVLAMLEAVMNPIWVFLFIGEVPSHYGMVGTVLILGAVLANVILQNREMKKESVEMDQQHAQCQ